VITRNVKTVEINRSKEKKKDNNFEEKIKKFIKLKFLREK